MRLVRLLACLSFALPILAYGANQVGSIPVGNSPFALALSADSAQAVVVNLFPVKNPDGSAGPNVRVLDIPGQRELRSFRAGTRLVSIAVSGSTALVVNEDQDAVRILNVATAQEVGQITVGSRPSSVILLSATTAAVTNGTSGDISFLDVAARRVTATLSVGKDPRAVALHPSGTFAYVALGGDNAIAVIDMRSAPRVVGTVGVGRNPVGVAFSPDGSRAVAVNLTSNTLTVLDTSNPAAPRAITTVPVGAQPTFAVFAPLTTNLVFVSNQGANYVTVVDISKDKSQMVQGVIDLGTSSSALVVGNGGTRLYVTEFKNSANLRIFDLQNLGALSPKPLFDIPGEPVALNSLNARGDCATDFYIAEATLAPGAKEGFWGMEVALSREPRELTGGFNLGGGFDGGGRNPGFGAFSLSGPQRVTFTVNAQPLVGAIGLKVDLMKDGSRIGGVEGTPTTTSPLQFAADLTSGFHVVVINSTVTSGRGTFQLALGTPGSFAGGVVVGGFITRNSAGQSLSGFGAFCVPQTQEVAVKFFGQSEYGASAAGDLILTLRDGQRNVIRTVDNTLPGGGLVEPPPAPAVPSTINWYVDSSSLGGSGTSGSPFRSITQALASARSGDVIFVRKGTYSPMRTSEQLPIGGGSGRFQPGVQLIGAGAAETIIDGENSDSNLVVIASSGVRMAGFTVKRAGAVGIYVFRAANVVLENNFATGNVRFGLGGEGSSGLIVRNNVAAGNLETGIAFVGSVPAAAPPGAPTSCPAIAAGPFGAWIVGNNASDNRADGILTGGGGNFCVAQNITNNNGSSGIEFNNRSESGPVPPLNGAVINNTIIGNGAQQFAFAGTGILSAENGGTIDLVEGNRLVKNRPFGIGVFSEARAGRIVNNTVTDTGTSGILVSKNAHATEIADNTVTGSGLAGIFLDEVSSVGTIRNNQSTNNERGLSVLDRSTVTLVDGNRFDDNRGVGVEVVKSSMVTTFNNISASNNAAAAPSSGSGFQVRDGSIVGGLVASRILNNQGQGGIYVSNGSQLTMSGTTVDANATQGVFAVGAASRVTMTGGSITNTRNGFGVNAQTGAAVTCSGVAFSGNASGNVFTAAGATATGCN